MRYIDSTIVGSSTKHRKLYFRFYVPLKGFHSSLTWSLNLSINWSSTFLVSVKTTLNIIRLNSNNVFNIKNPLGLKLLTRLRIGFSHAKEHKFKHKFEDSVDSLCSCGNHIESTVYFFLHCPNFITQRQTLLNKLKSINASIMAENENSVVRTLLFGRPDFNYSTNKEIINATISFILTTELFNCPLF